MRWLYRFIFGNSYVIHLSENLIKGEIESLQLRKVKTKVIPNGIKIQETNKIYRYDGRFNILYLSNLFPEKGFIELIEVFRKLSAEDQSIFLTIAGGFPDMKTRKMLRKQINDYGLSDRIFLAGPRYGEEKQRFYEDSDMFVFPSFFRQECFPLVILEAMQAGLPIITTMEGAIPEIIENEKNGIIIPQKDKHTLEYQIRRLIKDKDLRAKLGGEARIKFIENYTLTHFEKNMRDFFEKELIKVH